MNKVSKFKNKQEEDRYKKVIDNAKKSLKSFEEIDFLDEIPDDSKPVGRKVVFPYGKHRTNPYNSPL